MTGYKHLWETKPKRVWCGVTVPHKDDAAAVYEDHASCPACLRTLAKHLRRRADGLMGRAAGRRTLREMREARGLALRDTKVGVSFPHLGRIERGEVNDIPGRVLARMAFAYEVPLADVFASVGAPSNPCVHCGKALEDGVCHRNPAYPDIGADHKPTTMAHVAAPEDFRAGLDTVEHPDATGPYGTVRTVFGLDLVDDEGPPDRETALAVADLLDAAGFLGAVPARVSAFTRWLREAAAESEELPPHGKVQGVFDKRAPPDGDFGSPVCKGCRMPIQRGSGLQRSVWETVTGHEASCPNLPAHTPVLCECLCGQPGIWWNKGGYWHAPNAEAATDG